MPIYEYSCRRCGREFEQVVLSKEPVNCPQCASGAVEKQLSVFSSPGTRAEENAPAGGGCACTPQTCGCR